MELTAKTLILDLLSCLHDEEMPVRALICAASVFGISENSLRVALARLLSRGLIERNERGQYLLAADARPVQSQVASWVDLQGRVVPWRGGWIGLHTGGMARARGSVLRQRQRALDFVGMRELRPGLWIRPDNLVGAVPGVETRLRDLGAGSGGLLFAMSLSPEDDAVARLQWDVDGLQQTYEQGRARIATSTEGLPDLELEAALSETFLVGRQVLHDLAFDPLLPDAIMPTEIRRAYVEEMRSYDRVGQGIWRQFLMDHGGPAVESLLGLYIDAARPAIQGES